MRNLLASILAIATASSALSQINAEDWRIQYYFTGAQTTIVDGQSTTTNYNHERVQGAGFGLMFKGPLPGVSASTSLGGTYEIHVKWVGQGQPPPYQFLKINSTTASNWRGSMGKSDGSNGLSDPYSYTPVNYGGSGQSSGTSSFPITLGQNGEYVKTVAIKGSASSYAVQGSIGATSSIFATVLPRKVDTWGDPGPTFFRGPGGALLNGGFQQDTGKTRVDRAYEIYAYFGEVKGQFFEKMVGQTVGDWTYPIKTFDWSGLSYKWINKFWDVGMTEAWNWEIYVDRAHLIQGFNGPDIRTSTAKISDTKGTEQGTIVFYTHSPVEGTGEKWKADVAGPARLARIPEAKAAGFYDKVIGSISNYSNQKVAANVTISDSASYTYGAQEEYGGSAGFEWEIVKLNFSTTVTKSSSETYQIGKTYSIGVDLQPHSMLMLISSPMGSVKFPICSHWNQSGYSGDTQNLDVVAGYIDYAIFIKKVDPWD